MFYAAGFLGRVGDELTLCSLTAARIEADCTDPDLAVAGILQIRDQAALGGRETKRYDLPCGPAALTFEYGDGLVLSSTDLGAAEDLPVPVAVMQAFIPVPAAVDPDCRTMAVITFSTPSAQHWNNYCAVMVDLLRSFRFPAATPTGPGSSIRDALG